MTTKRQKRLSPQIAHQLFIILQPGLCPMSLLNYLITWMAIFTTFFLTKLPHNVSWGVLICGVSLMKILLLNKRRKWKSCTLMLMYLAPLIIQRYNKVVKKKHSPAFIYAREISQKIIFTSRYIEHRFFIMWHFSELHVIHTQIKTVLSIINYFCNWNKSLILLIIYVVALTEK